MSAKKILLKILLLLIVCVVVGLTVFVVHSQKKHIPLPASSGMPSHQTAKIETPLTALKPASGYFVPSDFTLQEKIGQLLFVGVVSKDLAVALESKYQIGGFLLMTGSDLFSAQATMAVEQAGQLPPLFAIDQEGGEVSRLPNNTFKQYTAKYMAALPDEQVEQIAQTMGQQMAAISANVNFAPVLDLDNGKNAAISIPKRSFGVDPAVVAQKATAFAKGLRSAKVVPTFKHFPGLGRATGPTNGNTDTGTATSPPLQDLEQNDLKPYETVINQGLAAVMVGNQTVPNLTNGLPASLSVDAYSLLRTKYGFTQVIFTDEIADAKAVSTTQPTAGDAVIAALKAGADMPLINVTNQQQVDAVIAAVTKAVLDGRLSESQLNTSLTRVLQLKTAIKAL